MKRGAPKHPKVFALCSLLKVKRPTAIGILEMLWHMCAEYTPQGDIGKYSDDWIEASLDWTGRKGHLINCLVEARWLDREPATTKDFVDNDEGIRRQWPGNRKIFVHDWHDHADSVVQKRLERLHLPFLTVREKVTGQRTVTDQFSAASRARDPIPSSSLPIPSNHPPTPSKPPGICASADARVGSESTLPKTARSGDGRQGWFDAWWEIFWLDIAKKAAQQAFKTQVRTPERFQEIMRATEAQRPGMLAREPRHRPHGATWLRDERWNDKPSQPRAGPNKSPTVDQLTQSIEAFRRTR